ncbi:MAG TPA: PAS domain S-box protein [Burkholderiaceae bacterium]|nr:PAS domain S-box protein [Burkholderiaceae bacterium]
MHLGTDFFEAAFNLSAATMLVVDREGRILRANPAFGEFTGCVSAELTGALWMDFLHPDDGAVIQESLGRVLSGQAQSFRREQRYRHSEGRAVWGDMQASLVGDGQRGAPLFLVHVLDITERRQRRERDHYQRALLDNFPFLVWLKDEDSRLLAANKAYADACGVASPEDLLDKTDLDLWPEDLARGYRADDREVMRTRRKKSIEEPIEVLGMRKWFETYKAPIEDAHGRLYGTVGFARDITDRLHAQQQLALIDFAFNQVKDAAFLIDASARFRYVNDEACRSLGYARDELLGLELADIDPDFPTDRWPVLWAHIKVNGSHTIESHHRTRDGRRFPVEVIANYFEYEGQAYNLALVRDITERVRVQAVIRDKEQRYREIFDNASDALYLLEITEDGRFRNMEVNPALAASVGMPRDELIGKFVDDTVPPEAAQAVVAKYRRCIESGVAVEEEVELLLPVGRRTYHSTLIPVRNNAGRIHRIIGIRRDITQHRLNEELVQQRLALEKLLGRLIELTPGAFGVYQLATGGAASAPFSSPNHEDVVGISAGDWARDPGITLRRLHPDDICAYMESLRESARTMTAGRCEYRIQHPRKGETWIEGHFTPERQPDGEVLWYGFVRDVSERKRAEKLLRAREQEFRTLAEHSPDMIVRLDRDCRRVYVNPAYEKETGIPLRRALRSTFDEDWWPTMPRDAYKVRLQKVMETGVPDQFLVELRKPDRDTASYEVRVVAEYDDDGWVQGLLAIGRNVTAQQQAERSLRASTLQIRELAAHRERLLEQERKRIAREIHDELGQLLSVLHLRIQILQTTFGADNPALDEQSRYLATLVSKTQQVARDITAAIRPAALGMGVVAALEWQAQELALNTGIQCHVSSVNVQLDEERATAVLRIVQESLTNAVRHSGANAVKIELDQQREFYILKISDNGRGFEPARPVKEKSFGLVGIRERALMLGGDVVVTSAPQQGASLQVRFPVQHPAGDPAQ